MTLRAPRVVVLLGVLAGVANAASVAPPAGWLPDAAKAVSLTQRLDGVPHFGGIKSVVTTEAYRAPAGGAALFVTRAVANVTADQRDRAATAELSELKLAERYGKAEHVTGLLVSQHLIEERVTAVGGDGIRVIARAIVAGDAQRVVSLHGECLLAVDAPAAVVAECKQALDTLDPDIPVAARVALALVALPPVGTEPATPPVQAPSMGPSKAPLLDDGKPITYPTRTIPQDRPSTDPDRRPVYLGLGLVVLAAVFWWNRKRRERFDREDERAAAATPAAPTTPAGDPPARTSSDTDADDLHAAAEGGTNEDGKS